MALVVGKRFALLGVLVLSTFMVQMANGDLVTDFESEPVDGVTDGNLTNLTVTGAGVTVDIFRSSGIGFDVINDDAVGTSNSFPSAVFGNQTLSPFFNPAEPDEFVANFSTAVASVSLDAGDFGVDNDVITVTAFSGLDGTGTLLDTHSILFSGNLNDPGPENEPVTLVVDGFTGIGIRSITFGGNGGVGATNSVFFDNLQVTFIPEPSMTLCLSAMGFGLLTRRRKRN